MAKGKLIKVNGGGQHGTIERTDDGSTDWYQFRITEDCVAGCQPTQADLNKVYDFTPVNDTAKRATDVEEDGDGGNP